MVDQPKRPDPGLRLLTLAAAASVLWLASYALATKLLHRYPDSAMARGALAALGILGFVLWLVAIARLIRVQDEFERRIHLIALAVAFGATALLVFAADFLQRAGFVDRLLLRTIWMAMIALWWIAAMVVARVCR
jgi:hypothetical protein